MADTKRLLVCYDGPLDQELDESFQEMAQKRGWTLAASGRDKDLNMRTLEFYKRQSIND